MRYKLTMTETDNAGIQRVVKREKKSISSEFITHVTIVTIIMLFHDWL